MGHLWQGSASRSQSRALFPSPALVSGYSLKWSPLYTGSWLVTLSVMSCRWHRGVLAHILRGLRILVVRLLHVKGCAWPDYEEVANAQQRSGGGPRALSRCVFVLF